ncbi:tetraacyldisaccharide 4'-kinase [soil metagenome]
MGLLSALYGLMIARCNRRYTDGRADVHHASLPVISVGNVSVGGTGKTPTVHAIARMLQEHGFKPAIVMRGYGRSTRGARIVRSNADIEMNARQAGDEAMLHAYGLQVPVVVAEKRIEGAALVAEHTSATVIILDDGFQHRSIYRDLDVVLVNEATIADQRLLPEGRLREPLSSLERADVVLLTQNGVSESDVRPFMRADALVVRTHTEIRNAYSLASLANVQQSVELRDRVIAVTAIANPERFHASLQALSGTTTMVRHMALQDHHRFRKRDVMMMINLARKENVRMVVTTEKDAVKLVEYAEQFSLSGIEVAVLPIRLLFDEGKTAFEQLLLQRIAR